MTGINRHKQLLDVKTKICKMKNVVGKINSILDIAEGKVSKLEDIAIKTIQIRHTEKKKGRASLGCEITLSQQIHT